MTTNQIQTNWPLQKPQQLVYVELGPDNGGMVLGICEQGLSFRAVAPLKAEGPVYFTFALDEKTRLNGAGEIAWSEDGGKSGGLKFTNISQQFRETLQAWLASEAKPKAIGREVAPAAALPLDSLAAPKLVMRPTDATSVEEAKPPVAPPVPIETAHAAPGPVIPAPDAPRSTSPASIVEPKPPEPKPVETKPVEHIQPERVVDEVPAEVSTPAPPQKIEAKPAEAKPEPLIQKPVQSQPVKLDEAPPVEPVIPEPELRSAAPLPPDETQPQHQHAFSLPGFRLPSATFDAPPAESVEPPRPRTAKPEPAAIEPPFPQAPLPPPSMEQWHVEEPEPRRLIPPPANPEPWEFPDMREADEEDSSEESPRMNRAFASGIVGIAMAVLLAALVLSFRHEVGKVLIRVGEALSGEDRNQVVRQQPLQTVVPAQSPSPTATQTQKAVDQPSSQTANTGNVPQSTSPVPPQAVNANPAATNPSSENSASADSTPANSASANSAVGNPTSTNAGSPDAVREIQDLPPPKDGGSGQKEFEQARNMLKGNHRQRELRGAVDLLWTGVAKGYVPAEVTLADLYARGDGVSKNCTQARLLLRAAIQKGSPEARRRLDQLKRQGCP